MQFEIEPDLRSVTAQGRTFRVGDTVTWRRAPKVDATFASMGVSGCRIVGFGETETCETAAAIEAMGQTVGALVADLHPEQ